MKNLAFTLVIAILSCSSLNAQWVQIGNDIGGEAEADLSGYSVDLSSDGQTIAIGATGNSVGGLGAGHVRVFYNNGGIWEQIGNNIDGISEGGLFGRSVSLSGDGTRVAISAPNLDVEDGDGGGQVRVFEYTKAGWTQLGESFDGSHFNEGLGTEVSLSRDGKILAMSADHFNGVATHSGRALIFQEIDGEWIQIGNDLEGDGIFLAFGSSISLSGNGQYVAVGARANNYDGITRVFEFVDKTWTQVGQDLTGTEEGSGNGASVCLNYNGSRIVMGHPFNSNTDGAPNLSGMIMVLQNTNNVWEQVGEDIYGETENEQSGLLRSIAISDDGNTVAVSASQQSVFRGAARVFTDIDGTWTQQGETLIGDAFYDFFGQSVSLSGDGTTLAVGARQNENFGGNTGVTEIFQLGPTGIEETQLQQVNVFPNPSNGLVRIDLENNTRNVTLRVFNTYGQKIKTEKQSEITSFETTLPEATGLYFLQLTSESGETKTIKVVRE